MTLFFAGGGTAACIIASRLATAFPDLQILVLESGPTTKDKMDHIQPGHYITHPRSRQQDGAVLHVEGIGARCRPAPSWFRLGAASAAAQVWESGWSAKEMIPMLRSLIRKSPTHGATAPLKVSYGGEDRPYREEGNGLDLASINVFFRMPKWISSDARRSDVAHHYIYNKTWKNLSVLDGCLVRRVVIENDVATGVEYLFNNQIHESAPQDIRTVKARKMVVVSAGTMGSPLILERSGVGKKEVLERAGIPVVAELPGVGENYQGEFSVILAAT
ncbi:hypothetical protein B0H15DRAFT_957324 [Mycena belliarum]|uniref:Glucose-methanol-choline oxidoreductase N-terminal domain-containing protein n=1 Tax=Mycena belliarum TaxID=1033014 RepID=A0AAD6TRB5_9AGAR|nr:hypothetical protein B0H15DRAFT_957324 [Mycena belliae]